MVRRMQTIGPYHREELIMAIPSDSPQLPPGWSLARRSDRDASTTLHFRRHETPQHWVIATGRNYEDALQNGQLRLAHEHRNAEECPFRRGCLPNSRGRPDAQ
jgi:hypothetical protein